MHNRIIKFKLKINKKYRIIIGEIHGKDEENMHMQLVQIIKIRAINML